MSNRRYVLEIVTAVEISRTFHELVRVLELKGFSVELLDEGSFRAKRTIQVSGQQLTAVVRGKACQGGMSLVMDLYDPPSSHVPDSSCDAIALQLAEVVSKAVGARVVSRPRFAGLLAPPRQGELQSPEHGEVHVRRVPCG